MLNIIFGRENSPDFVLDTRIYFRRNKKPEWFKDEFVKRFLKEIDNSTVLFEEAINPARLKKVATWYSDYCTRHLIMYVNCF